MNKIYTMLVFILSLQCLAQKQGRQEHFNFTDTTFSMYAIKRVSYIFPDCQGHINEYDRKNIDSIVNFLATHKSMILELGVKNNSIKSDKRAANYYKSFLVDRGADSTRIVTAGYGRKYQPYSGKEIKKAKKENTTEGWIRVEKMDRENFCFELKIIKQ